MQVVLNGLAALDEVRKFNPQVVLLDIGMPAVDGHEVTRRLRREPDFQQVPIIIISGHGRDEDVERSLRSGANHHLMKPLDFDKLWAALDEAAETSGQR